MGRVCGTRRERRRAYRVFVGKTERKRPIVKTSFRWEDNIKMDVQSIWRAWTGLIWLAIVVVVGLF
jgi:hypothetical protein